MKKILIFLILFVFNYTFSQSFQHTYGDSLDESAFAVLQTSDHGFAIAGFSNSFTLTGNDLYVIRTDSLGAVRSKRIYSGDNKDEAYSLLQTGNGGFLVTGYTRSFGALYYDAFLLKLNMNGDTLWTKTYGAAGSEFANTAAQTSDGGFVFAGYTLANAIDSAQGSIYLVKVDSAGNRKWEKALGPSTQITDAYSIIETTDKGFAITGYTNGYNEINGDAFLLKTDSTGNPLFMKTYGHKGFDWGYSVKQTSDSGYVIGGSYSADSASTDIDAYVIKTDANGDTLWTRTYGGTGNDYGQSIALTGIGNYALAGYTSSFGAGNYDAYLLEINANGDTVFARAFGAAGDDEANSIFCTADGGFILGGQSNSFGNGYNYYVVKTDAYGNSPCFQTDIHGSKRVFPTQVNAVNVKQDTVTVTMIAARPNELSAGNDIDACTLVHVKNNSQDKELTIYPSPNEGSFRIRTTEMEGILIVSDLLGNVLMHEHVLFAEEIRLPVSTSAGSYFIRVFSNGKSYAGKILVNK